MTQTAPAIVAPGIEIADAVDAVLDDLYAVIIMDSDFTTFAEVEGACMSLFGYGAADAAALAVKVHTTGEALAAVLARSEARRAVAALRVRNVIARAEPV